MRSLPFGSVFDATKVYQRTCPTFGMVEIVRTEGVLGGKPRLEDRRIGVLRIAELILDAGRSPEEVADQLGISLADVHAALAYYYEHADEMRTLRREREALEARLREDALSPPDPVDP
jgi:uncharacterized protein (DUF433 family)